MNEVLAGRTPYAVKLKAVEIGIRPDWPERRLAVMTDLLQYRFRNEPDFAELLLSTGNSQILYVVWDDVYWGYREGGENWMGRLLELVRSDLGNDRSE